MIHAKDMHSITDYRQYTKYSASIYFKTTEKSQISQIAMGRDDFAFNLKLSDISKYL